VELNRRKQDKVVYYLMQTVSRVLPQDLNVIHRKCKPMICVRIKENYILYFIYINTN